MSDTADSRLRAARAAFDGGDFARAAELTGAILAADPGNPGARALRANAWLRLERWNEAIDDLVPLASAQPQNAQLRRLLALCWLRIGNRDKLAGEREAAADAYRRAIAAAPEQHDARQNLGALLLTADRAGQALPLLRTVAAAEPDNEIAALLLARALFASGDRGGAAEAAEVLFARAGDPQVRQGCVELLLDAGATGPARSFLQTLATAASTPFAWIVQQARRLRENADADGSRAILAAAARRAASDEDRVAIALHAALGLPSVYADAAQVEAERTRFGLELDRLIDAYPPARLASILSGPEPLRWDNFLLAYQGRNDRELQRRFGSWYGAAVGELIRLAPPAARAGREHPRIAMVSGRWHHCTVGVYFAAWVEHLAAHGWEVVLVHAGAFRDAWTERLAAAAHGELTLVGGLADSAQRVRDLEADVVLYPELGMDSTVLALASLRLARRQACAWGHPATTGLPTIDAFISCAEMEPPNATQHYSERLLLLPGLGTRYPAPEPAHAATRAAVGLPTDRRLYLVPQSAFKLHPDNDAVLGAIVERDDDAVLVLFEDHALGAARCLQQRLLSALAGNCGQPESRLLVLPRQTRSGYLAVNRLCDVMVDSLHWSGGNTTLDALHCALPVVTCPGELMRGRQSAAMLRMLGHAELVADSPARLAERAVAIARDAEARARTGRGIAAALPALTESAAPLEALDRLLREFESAPD